MFSTGQSIPGLPIGRMRGHLNSLLIMMVAQACCVALGLQMHDSYVRASVANGEIPAVESDASVGDNLASAQPALRLLSVGWILLMQLFIAFLTLSRVYREIQQEMEVLRVRALTRERQVRTTRDALIFGLAALAESRDPETGRHLERISLYSSCLATELYRRGLYPDVVTREFLRTIGSSSTLHDIGKVSVSDAVLRKPGALTEEERMHIQTHTVVGGDCIRSVEQQTGDSRFLRMAYEIALHHHERWDGHGYPHRLSGESIPLAARIVAVADVYDALSMQRTYKPALPHEQCVETIASGGGTQFDPAIVEAFLNIEQEFADIAVRNCPGESVTTDTHVFSAAGDGMALHDVDVDEEQVLPLSLLLSSLQEQPDSVSRSRQEDSDGSRSLTAAGLPASPSA